MAIPVARVHLAMEHAALPGLLPTPPKCTMLMPPPCVVILPISSPPKPSRADAAERWDAHKIKPSGSPTSSSGGRSSLDDGDSGSSGSASSCERWGDKKKIAAAMSTSGSRTSIPGRSSSSSSSCADSAERWDARKKPVSLSSSSSSSSSAHSSSSSSSSKGWCDSRKKRRPSSRASSIAGRWDAHKKPMALPRTTEELDDGESSSGSNDMEYVDTTPLPESAFYAGPGFMAAPDASMLPMPTLLMRSVCAA